MYEYLAVSQIQLTRMTQLAEAIDKEDDWTGLTDAASRRKRQNRLNVRAYRRRKALESKEGPASVSRSGPIASEVEAKIPCWVEDQQTISVLPVSVANSLHRAGTPLIPYESDMPNPATFKGLHPARIIFPLSPDHLITLLQFNVLRGCLENRRILSQHRNIPPDECSSAGTHVFTSASAHEALPLSLQPTVLQRTVPHEAWIDIIPHPGWRDNVIRASGNFDEDDLWSDTVGGLFEGFPASDVELHGIVAWSPPWDINGWEVTEGFYRKWGWSFKGCEDVLDATNRWRRKRGEKPLVFRD